MDNPLYSNTNETVQGDREWIRSTRREFHPYVAIPTPQIEGQPALLFSNTAWAVYGILSLIVGIVCRVCGAPGFALFFWMFTAVCVAVIIDEAVYQRRLARSHYDLARSHYELED